MRFKRLKPSLSFHSPRVPPTQPPHISPSCPALLRSSDLGQPLLKALEVSISLLSLAATGAALHKLHPHWQLGEVKVLALLSQLSGAPYGGAIQAGGGCRAGHS